ncbi:CHASE2 domain-containing protein [Candidatus Peregrinibacteria bacterium]|nr:CHASE2 domain-containing protein [Candidatus Peregrinibacteria bacterium]
MGSFLKNRVIAGVLIGAFITMLVTIFLAFDLFNGLHQTFSNSLYEINNPSQEIVIIAIDDKSTQPAPEGLGRFSQWSRENFTKLLGILKTEKPIVIGFDLIFHTPTTMVPREKLLVLQAELQTGKPKTTEEKLEIFENFLNSYRSSIDNPIDKEFANALQEFDNIVLAASVSNNGEIIQPLPDFSQNASLGIVNSFLDENGILRASIPKYQDYDDFGIAAAKKYLAQAGASAPGVPLPKRVAVDLNLPLENDQFLVNFFGDPYSFEMIPFVNVLKKKFDPETFKNKIVLIGMTSAKEIHDEFLTPRSNTTPMPGVEFRANEIQTILEEKFLEVQGKLSIIITVLILGAALSVIFNYLGIIFSLVIALASLALYYFSAHFFYSRGLILNMVYPFIAIVLSYIGSYVYRYFIADKNKRELKNAFGHYVSEKLVEQIAKNPEMVKLGGEKRPVTVLFSDIKDSTAISEKTEISAWVGQMNEYFTVMEEIIKRFGGTVDKYEGDAIMCFWNAPISQENHQKLAYGAALEMSVALVRLHEKWRAECRPLLEFRIGINSGEAIVGNFGSKTRFDYTATGDTVNAASRLESSVNKTYGTKIAIANPPTDLLTKASAQQSCEFLLREIDTVIVPGKTSALVIYELMGVASGRFHDLMTAYSSGLAAYRSKDFAGAIEYFKVFGESDPPSKVMLERCLKLLAGEKIAQVDENMIFHIIGK